MDKTSVTELNGMQHVTATTPELPEEVPQGNVANWEVQGYFKLKRTPRVSTYIGYKVNY